ncbi:MAG: WD40 repeat domain-containing protein [Hyphomicrobium aestuarii]|nr:WD40 repeat domain-containing protein [Hyphomicrobium aestuarii]
MSGPHDEFHEKDRKLDADLKGKLDFFLWHQRFKAGYQSWSRAHNDKKPALLLTGQPLSIAENWLLLHPSKFSDGERRFVMRSVAQSTQSVVSSEVVNTNRRRSRRGLVIPLLAAGLITGLIALPRMTAQRSVEPPQQTADAEQHSDAPKQSVELPSEGGGSSPSIGTVAVDRSSAQSATPPAASPAVWKVAADHIRKLAAISDERRHAGDARQGLMVGVEALRRVALMAPGTERDDSIMPAATSVLRALSRTSPLGAGLPETKAVPSTLLCSTTDIAVIATEGGDIRGYRYKGMTVEPKLTAQRPGSPLGAPLGLPIRAERRLLDGAAVDSACKLIVLPRDDDTAEVYGLESGRRISRFEGHGADLTVTAFSPDGRSVASGGRDNTVRLWDAATGRSRLTLEGHDGTIHALAFDAKGGRIASAGSDRVVRVWDTASGRQLARWTGHYDTLRGVAFSPDGTRVLAFGDGAVRIHAFDASVPAMILRAPGRALLSAKMMPEGDRVIAVADDGSAIMFKADSGEPVFELTRSPGAVRSVAIGARTKHPGTEHSGVQHSGGQQLISLGWNGDVMVHDAETGHGFAVLTETGAKATAAGFSADGSHAVAILDTGAIVTTPMFASVADALDSATGVAGGCLDGADVEHLKAGPAAVGCDVAIDTPSTGRPWLIAAAPKKPSAREVAGEFALTTSVATSNEGQ